MRRTWLLSLLTLILNASPAFAATQVATHWVQPMRTRHGFELQPQERTRPIVMGDVLYAANLEGNVYAIHRTDGYLLWKYKMPAPVDGSLAYGRSKLVVGDTQGNLIALNARDGSVSWKFKISAEWQAPVAFLRDRLFAMTSSDELYALGDAQGKELWHYAHRGDEKMTVHGTAGPAVFGNEVYQGFSDGTEVALSAQKGNVIWQRRLKSRERFYDIDMTAWVDETSVIAAAFDGKVYHLNRASGDTRWLHPTGAYGGFLVEEGRVYFAGLDGRFYAIERDGGRVVWSTPYKGGVGMTPVRVGDAVVFTTSGDPMYVLDMKSGEVLATYGLGTGSLAAPTAAPDGWFYALSNYGNLLSFELFRTLTPKTMPAPATVPTPSLRPRLVQSDFNKVDS